VFADISGGRPDMAESPPDLNTEITQLEVELERVLALSAVTDAQRKSLRERLRQLKAKAEREPLGRSERD
jgi:hypothetical protein